MSSLVKSLGVTRLLQLWWTIAEKSLRKYEETITHIIWCFFLATRVLCQHNVAIPYHITYTFVCTYPYTFVTLFFLSNHIISCCTYYITKSTSCMCI
jgi:hypothetical protein